MNQVENGYEQTVWQKVIPKMEAMRTAMDGRFPHASSAGRYDEKRPDWWTSGFWPGMLWILYDLTGDPHYKEAAWSYDEVIAMQLLEENNFHHDVGFQFLTTAVIKYKITGDPSAKRRAILGAHFLAGRFNAAGRFIRAWNQDKTGWSIIDTTMNLSLLFWAFNELKDPRFLHIGQLHADTVLKHFIRENGSVRHIVRFDPENGAYMEALGGQGFSADSAWSRGQAWALYGLANAFRYTGEQRYLLAAKKTARFFLANLPDDLVPFWDFSLTSQEGEPRDTSAAACAASGLIELARQVPEDEGTFYMDQARSIFKSLTEGYSTLDRLEHEGILLAGTGNKPADRDVNVSLIYGDYFYIETLAKLLGWTNVVF